MAPVPPSEFVHPCMADVYRVKHIRVPQVELSASTREDAGMTYCVFAQRVPLNAHIVSNEREDG